MPGWMGIGEDMPGGVATEWARWMRSPSYLLDHVDGARDRLQRFSAPLEVWGFTDDHYAPEAAVRAYANAVRSTGRTLRILHPAAVGADAIGHFGMFRSDFRDTLWEDAAGVLASWIR